MFSSAQIYSFQQQAARKAARAHRAPHVIFSEDTAFNDWRGAPFLGTYVPPSWSPVTLDRTSETPTITGLRGKAWTGNTDGEALTFFVDTTGAGTKGELAITVGEQQEVAKLLVALSKERKRTIGIALLEVGQFQAVIGVFERSWRKRKSQ